MAAQTVSMLRLHLQLHVLTAGLGPGTTSQRMDCGVYDMIIELQHAKYHDASANATARESTPGRLE